MITQTGFCRDQEAKKELEDIYTGSLNILVAFILSEKIDMTFCVRRGPSPEVLE